MDTTLPAGPDRSPLAQTLDWVLRPVEFMEACRREHGDCFTVRIGPADVVLVSDPAIVKEVFRGDPEVFHAGETNGLFRPILGANSILLLDGRAHMRQRRLMLPPFHGRAMRGYAELIRETARREVESWPAVGVVELLPRVQAITLEVVLRAVFG